MQYHESHKLAAAGMLRRPKRPKGVRRYLSECLARSRDEDFGQGSTLQTKIRSLVFPNQGKVPGFLPVHAAAPRATSLSRETSFLCLSITSRRSSVPLDMSNTDVVSDVMDLFCGVVADARPFHVVGGWVFLLEGECRGTRPLRFPAQRCFEETEVARDLSLCGLSSCSHSVVHADAAAMFITLAVSSVNCTSGRLRSCADGLYAGGLRGVLVFVVSWGLF